MQMVKGKELLLEKNERTCQKHGTIVMVPVLWRCVDGFVASCFVRHLDSKGGTTVYVVEDSSSRERDWDGDHNIIIFVFRFACLFASCLTQPIGAGNDAPISKLM